MSDPRVSPDGTEVALFRHPFDPDDRGDLVLLDRSGKLRTLSTGWESLEGLAWAPSGKEIWFSAAESGEQWCIHGRELIGQGKDCVLWEHILMVGSQSAQAAAVYLTDINGSTPKRLAPGNISWG